MKIEVESEENHSTSLMHVDLICGDQVLMTERSRRVGEHGLCRLSRHVEARWWRKKW